MRMLAWWMHACGWHAVGRSLIDQDTLAGTLRSFTTRVAHVLPVSDDGGSTAEIVRVLGGPAVGDIRSRCLRLADDSNTEVHPDAPCASTVHVPTCHFMLTLHLHSAPLHACCCRPA